MPNKEYPGPISLPSEINIKPKLVELQREMDWLDQHCSFVADYPYILGPFKRGELRKLAQAGLEADALGRRLRRRIGRCIACGGLLDNMGVCRVLCQ